MVENKYLVNNKISSQYFVIYPLLAMTEVKRFCKSSQGFQVKSSQVELYCHSTTCVDI